MERFARDSFANPTGSHRASREARQAIDESRDQIASLLGVLPGEIIFTSGGTESDNTVVFGAVRRTGGVAVTSNAEHHAVLHPVEHVNGIVVPVDAGGVIDLAALEEVLRQTPNVAVVSVMAVNNETGVITDMKSVSRVVREHAPKAIIHSDAVQAAPWMDLAPITAVVDSISLSAHKFGGPKGVGILWLRQGISVEPLMFGGGQERERRSGTHNVAGIVGTAAALAETRAEMDTVVRRVGVMRDRLVDTVTATVGGIHEVAPRSNRVPGSAHVCVEGVENEALLFLLDQANVCASAASACASGAMEPSHVLHAMGVDPNLARGALRMTLGHTTADADIDLAISALTESITHLRRS